jgi:hypothetical protein
VVEQVAKKTVLERDRPSQFITHLNSTLKEWFRSLEEGSKTEIQAAIYDSRCLLIASNKDATVERIYGEVVKKAVDTFLKDAASTAAERARKSNAKAAFRTERHALKLGQELTGKRPVGLPLIDKLKAEGGEICASFDVTRGFDHHIDDFAKILNGRDDRRSVVFLTSSGKEMHAEQKILLGLSKAAAPRKVDDPSSEIDRSSDVTVAGTFRPCRGCFESLSVVQHCCFNNLQFGSRPGHYWRTTEKGHVEILESLKAGGYLTEQQFQEDFDKNGLLIGLTNTTNRPSLLQPDGSEIKAFNYATDSDSDYEPSEAGSDYEMSEAGSDYEMSEAGSGGGSSEAG